jgi:hypothetical protein
MGKGLLVQVMAGLLNLSPKVFIAHLIAGQPFQVQLSAIADDAAPIQPPDKSGGHIVKLPGLQIGQPIPGIIPDLPGGHKTTKGQR